MRRGGKLLLALRIIMPLIALLSLIIFPPWELATAWLAPLPERVEEELEACLEHGFDGVIVYIDRGGETAVSYAAGLKSRDPELPADPDALFKIASIAKLYDAVAVTKLIAEGRLSLDQSLASAFPEYAGRIEHSERITVRMLVMHRSGLPNLTDTPNFWVDLPEDEEEAMGRILDLPAEFEPDAEYAYSNTNYLLLSMLMDRVLGYEHFDYIQEKILEPLGLENTWGSLSDVDPADVMSGYYAGVEQDQKLVDYGSMLATAEDVGRFIRALNEGSVFEAGEAEIYASLYTFGHTGLIPGYQSIAQYHGDLDLVLVQFTNTTDFNSYLWTLSEISYGRILKILRRQAL